FEDLWLAPEPQPFERDVLTQDNMESGWRLACRHAVSSIPDGAVLHVGAVDSRIWRKEFHAARLEGPASLCLAVDLGTTSLHWAAMLEEMCVAYGSELNPQLGAGSEVMSRIGYALDPQGGHELQGLVARRLEALAQSISSSLGSDARIDSLCLVGNAAMVAIALGKSVEGLSRAPYRLDFTGDAKGRLSDALPDCYVPAQIGPFVGADAAAGLVPLLRSKTPRPFLLADLGTNGEFILVREHDGQDEIFATSVALGPALEGIGLTHGAMAGADVVTRFDLGPMGLVAMDTEGRTLQTAAGISGTGYLSLVHTLLRSGVLGQDGRFATDELAATPLVRRLLDALEVRAGRRVLRLPIVYKNGRRMHLDPRDIEELLKVKAAFHVAFDALVQAAGIAAGDIASVQLAGALGAHVRHADLEGLGFVTPGMVPRLHPAGNLALEGAKLLCYDTTSRALLAGLARDALVLDLAADPGFHASFAAAMTFEHAL
ncbi:MAG: ASKHA domain-containing protein, partial [Oceanidesulfovibrio sp.]